MSRKPETIDKIAAKLTINIIHKIEVELNYGFIYEMVQLLYANADTLLTPQGGGHHGHISIIKNSMLYATLSNTAWVNPPNPVVYPTSPKNTTAYHQDQMQHHNDEVCQIYDNSGTIDEATKNQFIGTAKDTYLKELKNYYGFIGVTCHDILKYIIDQCGNITTIGLKANNQQMNYPIDLSMLIQKYFECVDDCIQYTEDKNTPYMVAQVLQKANHVVPASSLYVDA